jgi:hypothetical protein
LQHKLFAGVVSKITVPQPGQFPPKGGRVMMKIPAVVVLAGALLGLAVNAGAQAPPDIQKDTKSITNAGTGAAAPAPVTSPLGVGTAFNASLDDTLDTRRTKAGDAFVA